MTDEEVTPAPAEDAVAQTDGPTETVLLLPSHGLDDLPESLTEPHAAALLNAFALSWHPAFFATAIAMPRLVYVEEPPLPVGGRRFLLADFLRDRLPDGWENDAGARLTVIGPDRSESLARMAPLLGGRPSALPGDLSAFFALGLGHLWSERLTRKTHYYSTLDETRLRTEAVAAADALFDDQREEMRERLVEAAEILREARERFYPTPAKLCDLCFIGTGFDPEQLKREVESAETGQTPPLNLLGTGEDWRGVAKGRPELIDAIRAAGERVEPVGGEDRELPTPLRDLPAALKSLRAGRETFDSLFGSQPGVWGRFRFGLTPLTPQIL
ncbi:MAG: hypothetical protein AAF907_09855, partial [Planctomycetota bacterium]